MSVNARAALSAAAVLALVSGTNVSADSTVPIFYCFQTPGPGLPAFGINAQYIHEVRVNMHDSMDIGRTGAEAADAACDEILSRELDPSAEIWILLFGFGYGNHPTSGYANTLPIAYHPADGLTGDWALAGITKDLFTPWTDGALYHAETWINDFITQYEYRQGLVSYPDVLPLPTRMHFDTETVMHCDESELIFNWMMNEEDRWSTEYIRGTGQTLEDLYIGADSPTVGTQAWLEFYVQTCYQSMEGIFYDAIYSTIGSEWPNCKCSNYAFSMMVDGETTLSEGDRFVRQNPDPCDSDIRTVWSTGAQIQAPCLYNTSQAYANSHTGGDLGLAVLYHTRWLLDICIRSVGSGGPSTIEPWITLPYTNPEICQTEYAFCERTVRDQLAILRAKAIERAIVWNGDDNPDISWTLFHKAVQWVWGADIKSSGGYTVTTGTPETSPSLPLHYANNDPLIITSDGTSKTTVVEVNFESEFDSSTAEHLEINIETWRNDCTGCNQSTSVLATVEIWDRVNSQWDPVGSSFPVPHFYPTIKTVIDTDPEDHIDTDGDISIRVTHTLVGTGTSFKTKLDLVQVIRSEEGDGCPEPEPLTASFGRIAMGDVSAFAAAFTSDDLSADFTGDGEIDTADFTHFMFESAPGAGLR